MVDNSANAFHVFFGVWNNLIFWKKETISSSVSEFDSEREIISISMSPIIGTTGSGIKCNSTLAIFVGFTMNTLNSGQ